jgi:hypothetical protein
MSMGRAVGAEKRLFVRIGNVDRIDGLAQKARPMGVPGRTIHGLHCRWVREVQSGDAYRWRRGWSGRVAGEALHPGFGIVSHRLALPIPDL